MSNKHMTKWMRLQEKINRETAMAIKRTDGLLGPEVGISRAVAGKLDAMGDVCKAVDDDLRERIERLDDEDIIDRVGMLEHRLDKDPLKERHCVPSLADLADRVDIIEKFLRKHTAPDKPPVGSLSATTKEMESEDMAKQPQGKWICSKCGDTPSHQPAISEWWFPYLCNSMFCDDSEEATVQWVLDEPCKVEDLANLPRQDAEQGQWICSECGEIAPSYPAMIKGGAHYICNHPGCKGYYTVRWVTAEEPPTNPPRQDDLQARIDTWQRKTFGNSQSFAGMIAHLKREIDELVELREPEEMADCAILLFGMAAHAKVDLLGEVEKKFAIIQTRIYGEPDADNVIEHIAPTNPPRQDDDMGQYVGMLCEFYSLVTQVWFTAILKECAKGQGFNFLPEGCGVWHMNCRPHPQTLELIAAREEIERLKEDNEIVFTDGMKEVRKNAKAYILDIISYLQEQGTYDGGVISSLKELKDERDKLKETIKSLEGKT